MQDVGVRGFAVSLLETTSGSDNQTIAFSCFPAGLKPNCPLPTTYRYVDLSCSTTVHLSEPKPADSVLPEPQSPGRSEEPPKTTSPDRGALNLPLVTAAEPVHGADISDAGEFNLHVALKSHWFFVEILFYTCTQYFRVEDSNDVNMGCFHEQTGRSVTS